MLSFECGSVGHHLSSLVPIPSKQPSNLRFACANAFMQFYIHDRGDFYLHAMSSPPNCFTIPTQSCTVDASLWCRGRNLYSLCSDTEDTDEDGEEEDVGFRRICIRDDDAPLTGISKACLGNAHALCLSTDGVAYAWGLLGDSGAAVAPQQALKLQHRVVDIAAGAYDSLILLGLLRHNLL